MTLQCSGSSRQEPLYEKSGVSHIPFTLCRRLQRVQGWRLLLPARRTPSEPALKLPLPHSYRDWCFPRLLFLKRRTPIRFTRHENELSDDDARLPPPKLSEPHSTELSGVAACALPSISSNRDQKSALNGCKSKCYTKGMNVDVESDAVVDCVKMRRSPASALSRACTCTADVT
jgi:hypothetical protein